MGLFLTIQMVADIKMHGACQVFIRTIYFAIRNKTNIEVFYLFSTCISLKS